MKKRTQKTFASLTLVQIVLLRVLVYFSIFFFGVSTLFLFVAKTLLLPFWGQALHIKILEI